jgi:hypothetical protein
VFRVVGRGIRPIDIGRMRQRHVTRAKDVHLPQRRQRIADLMAAFDADERGDFSGLELTLDVLGGVGHCKIDGVTLHHSFDDIDLFDGHLNRRGTGRFNRNPH